MGEVQSEYKIKELSALFKVPQYKIYQYVRSNFIKGTKKKGKWYISSADALEFKKAQTIAVENLRKKYIDLYWSGLEPEQIDKRCKQEFDNRGIILFSPKNFATISIYESLLKGGVKHGHVSGDKNAMPNDS